MPAKKTSKKPSAKHRVPAKSLANLKGNKHANWKPGVSGNPKGAPKARINLFRYICEYMEMTPNKLKKLDQNKLTMSQRAALKTVMKMADDGEWQRISRMIDHEERDEGMPNELIKMVIEYVDKSS